MLTVLETGTIYNEINKHIIEFETKNNHTLAWCENIKYNLDEETFQGEWSRPITLEEKNEATKRIRGLYLQEEADPLFFKYQRGEITEKVWLDKVQEIRDRFPYKTI